jgi:large subunit ribosomal protein L1
MQRYSKRMKFHNTRTAGVGLIAPREALAILRSLEPELPAKIRKCRFDQTVVVQASLGVDPRQADQIVRGSIVLPHGIGKTQRVIAFAQGENAVAATAAGADEVGGKDLAEKIKAGWLDFDVAIAATDMMGVVGPLGRILGPRGLMPSPKAGTVTQDVASVVREYKAGKVEFRCDSGGNVNCVIGKISFSEDMLLDNLQSFLQYLRTLKPQSSKGQYIRRVGLVGTMTPSITISV